MKQKPSRLHIGPRTIKTAVAVIISMFVVDLYGTTTSRLIFAMLGAMAALEPTFLESLEASVSQIVGVAFGAVAGALLLLLPLPSLVIAGIGIVLVITLYNALKIRFSPSLACLIVVTMCTTPDIKPMDYALGRIWDTAIGLTIGLLINSLILPYDNSRQIRGSIRGLDRELIRFLEEMFDGDSRLPNSQKMAHKLQTLASQLEIFSRQRLFFRLRRQRQQLENFQLCRNKARELLARMEVLSLIDQPGRLTPENREQLEACGAEIRDCRPWGDPTEKDIVTNYHLRQILRLRKELLEALRGRQEDGPESRTPAG